jgi:hypothetical protein
VLRESLNRVSQGLIKRGRKRRSRKIPCSSGGPYARPAIEGLEQRTLLSTLTLTNGALVYAPTTSIANTVTMSHSAATHRYTFVDTTEAISLLGGFISPSGDDTHTVSFGDGNITSIAVNTGNQDFHVNIEQTLAVAPVTVNLGNGTDVVNISPSASDLGSIQGAIAIHGAQGTAGLGVFDAAIANDENFSIGAGSLTRSGAAPITYTGVNSLTVYAGGGNNTFNVSGTPFDTVLETGNGQDTVNVNGTGSGGLLTIDEGSAAGTGTDTANIRASNEAVDVIGHGRNTVNIGNLGSVQAINGPVTITDPAFLLATINVDDSGDSTARTVSLDTATIGGASYGTITGLAPATIQYADTDAYSVAIKTGTGGATVNALATTSVPVNLVGNGHGTDTVNVGKAGSLQAINGDLTVTNPLSFTTLNVDDSTDSTPRTVYLNTVTIASSAYGIISGLAPADIQYKYADTDSVTVQTGTGGATVNVLATGVPVNLIGHGLNTINVGNAGSVQVIDADLTISDPLSVATVNVDDSADSTPRTVYLDATTIDGSAGGRIVGLAPGTIQYRGSDVESVTVQTGTGGATDNVLSTEAPVTLVGHGSDTVGVGYLGSVQYIQSDLTITDPPSFATLYVGDSADAATPTVTLDTVTINGSDYGRITGLAAGTIWYKYADTLSVAIATGPGGATVNAQTTSRPVDLIGNPSGPISLLTSDADNTWTITSLDAGTLSSALLVGTVTFSEAANLTGGNGADTFVFADGAGVDGTIDGGGGTNSLDYSAYSGSVLVDLQTGFATGVGQGFANIQNVIGGSAANTLMGPDDPTSWSITAADTGTLSDGVAFANFGTLVGGAGDSSFAFADGATLSGSITGGGGSNTLDYSAYSTTVMVNLQTGFATGVEGGVASVQNVTGGTGGGAGVYNILVGNGGNVLTGGDGRRNLLIAGASASTLIGGNDDDILIGGTTAYDTEPGLVSLQAIMDYWSNTADDYGTRVANLMSGNGVPLLDTTMVTNNGGGNTLTGNHAGAGEMNLFYGMDPTLEATDYNPAIGEKFINC